MVLRNYEFKSAASDIEYLEKKLLGLNPVFKGEDHQTDTYFNINTGRLKLREGNIEHALIFYERPEINSARQSDVILYSHEPGKGLKELLAKALGVKAVVDKIRRIYFVDNVKFHFDKVAGLGTFIEVEAIARDPEASTESLKRQCEEYISFFGLDQSAFIGKSYCDLLTEESEGRGRV